MKVKVYIPATYTIPKRQLPKVVREYRKTWGDDIELYPGDLAILAMRDGIGKIEYDETEFECHEEFMTEEELAEELAGSEKDRREDL